MDENKEIKIEELAKDIGIKIERISTLMEVLERGIEQEYEIKTGQMETLSYIISDYISELKGNFEVLEKKIADLTP